MSDLASVEVLAWLCTELERVHVKGTVYAGFSEAGEALLAGGGEFAVAEVSLAHDCCTACHTAQPVSQSWPCATLKLVQRAKDVIEGGSLDRRARG